MKAEIGAVEASPHLNRMDELTVSCHTCSLSTEAMREGDKRGGNNRGEPQDGRKKRGKNQYRPSN